MLFSVSPSEPPLPWTVRVGTAVGASTLAALAATLPATLRVSAVSHEGATSTWLTLSAALLLPVSALVMLLRASRRGLDLYRGEGDVLNFLGLATWASSSFLVLSALGAVLRATTHHHALAGTTFALLAVVVVVAIAAVTRRLVVLVEPWPRATARLFFTVLLSLQGVAFVLLASRVLRGSTQATSYLVDLTGVVLASAFASRRAFASSRALATMGPLAAMSVLVSGLVLLQHNPGTLAAVPIAAPSLEWPVSCLAQLVLKH